MEEESYVRLVVLAEVSTLQRWRLIICVLLYSVYLD